MRQVSVPICLPALISGPASDGVLESVSINFKVPTFLSEFQLQSRERKKSCKPELPKQDAGQTSKKAQNQDLNHVSQQKQISIRSRYLLCNNSATITNILIGSSDQK